MFENVISFFKRIGKKEALEDKSKNTAKERLQLVLMQDRANVSADFLDMMRQEIIEVIKKYIDVDESQIDVKLTNKTNEDGTVGAPALYANIPIAGIKENVRRQEETPKESSESKENNQETEKTEDKVEKEESSTENEEVEEVKEDKEKSESVENNETDNKKNKASKKQKEENKETEDKKAKDEEPVEKEKSEQEDKKEEPKEE